MKSDRRLNHPLACAFAVAVLCLAAAGGFAQSRNLAPGFVSLPRESKLVLMPVDVELFSISAGGIFEPRADWTDAAGKHFRAALLARQRTLGVASIEISQAEADDFAEVNALHAAIARAIARHHFGESSLQLPTKAGKLDWSLGDAVAPIKQNTGADYALFTWLRDSYASGERIAAMVVMALFGVGLGGGMQVGYASLVDLNTGQVLWFNELVRFSGDLREPAKADETLQALLTDFPPTK